MRKTSRRIAVCLVATVAAVLAVQPLVAREAPKRVEPTPSVRLVSDVGRAERGARATTSAPAAAAPRHRRSVRRSTSPSSRLTDKRAAVPGVVLVRFKTGDAASLRAFRARHGLGPEDVRIGEHSIARVALPKGRTPAGFSKDLAKDPSVKAASPNYFNKLAAYSAPNDPYYLDSQTIYMGPPSSPDTTSFPYARSWWMREYGANAASAWSHGFSAADYPVRAASSVFKVAVIDSGFYMNHPDRNANIVAGRDFCQSVSTQNGRTEDGDVTPAYEPGDEGAWNRSHGTCVAGEIAAATRNGTGVASIGYDTQVRVYKVAGPWEEGDPENGIPAGSVVIPDDALIDAIYRAVADGCKVISISLGSYDPNPLEEEAVQYAHDHGVVVVAATGNDADYFEAMGHPVQIMYPAKYDNVIGVGAQDLDPSHARVRAFFSNYGTGLDVTAPGVNVWGLADPSFDFGFGDSLYGTFGYTWFDGTSMATPVFSGSLAHMWRYMPSFTADEISAYMLQHSVDAGAAGYDTTYGWGFLDMGRVMSGFMADYPYLAPTNVSLPGSVDSTRTSLSWTSVPGYSVYYELSVDGSVLATTAAASLSAALPNGVHRVSLSSRSPRNWSDSRSSSSATVTVLPYGTGVLAGGAAESGSRDVRLSSSVTGAVSMRIDVGSGYGDWVPYSAESTVTLPNSDGTKTVRVQYRASGGNTLSASHTIVLDVTPPSGTIALKAGAATTRSTTIALTSNVVGATEMRLRIDGGVWVSGWKPFASSSTIALGSTLGTRTVTAEYRDALGHTIMKSDTIKVLRRVTTSRLSGSNRYATSVAVSKSMYSATAPAVVLASGQNFPDALCAAPLANAYGGPLLLTAKGSLNSAVIAEIKRLRPANVLIVGGSGVVSDGVKNAVAGMSWHPKVYRIWGSDRYKTAGAVANWVAAKRKKSGKSVTKVVVANGGVYTDALLAAPMAAAKGWPILLVKSGGVPAGTSAAIRALKAYGLSSALVVGNTTNVSSSAQGSLGVSTQRVSGTDRYDLSRKMADHALANGGTSSRIGIATGLGYADALSSGPMLAASAGSSSFGVLLFSSSSLTYPNVVPPAVSSWLKAHKSDAAIDKITAIGGAGVLTDGNRDAVVSLLD